MDPESTESTETIEQPKPLSLLASEEFGSEFHGEVKEPDPIKSESEGESEGEGQEGVLGIGSHHAGSTGLCLEKGWHRRIRPPAKANPVSTPYFLRASMAYWEQVGVYRQAGANSTEKVRW